MQLALGLLIFSWVMLLTVAGFTFREARNRRALTQKLKALEGELAEKNAELQELKKSLEQKRKRSV